MEITEEYRQLNRQLHCLRPDYGARGGRWADEILSVTDPKDTLLDYGCGKGGLKRELSGVREVREYDPAIPGKDAPPDPADYVVCTDVLEHVEPECLPDVLADIKRLGRKGAFLVVSTRPARKTLPDGRNAHLIQKPAEWWAQVLGTMFGVAYIEEPGEMVAFCKPGSGPQPLGPVLCKGVKTTEERHAQMRANLALPLPRLTPVPEHGGVLSIAAYGPTLRDTWPAIRGDVLSISGSHGFLLERGVVPKYHLECDPRDDKTPYITPPHPGVTYLLASVCHPAMFKKLEGFKSVIWNLHNDAADEAVVKECDPGGHIVNGGSTAGLNSVVIAHMLGYRDVHIHGMDSSSLSPTQRHAGAHYGKPQKAMRVHLGDGREFITTGQMVCAAREFLVLQALMGKMGMRLTIHGDGLQQAMCREAKRKFPELAGHLEFA